MAGSRLAREFDFARGMQRDQQRIRRLEVNRLAKPPVYGAAQIYKNYTPAYAISAQPDFTSPTFAQDTIGLSIAGGRGQQINFPANWVGTANVQLGIQCQGQPPLGEMLKWGIQSANGALGAGADPMWNSQGSTQFLGATIPLTPYPQEFILLYGSNIPGWFSVFGTFFAVVSIVVFVSAINCNANAYN